MFQKTIKKLKNEEFYGYFRDSRMIMQISCSRIVSYLLSHPETTIKNTIFHENYGSSNEDDCLPSGSIHKNQENCDFLWIFLIIRSQSVNCGNVTPGSAVSPKTKRKVAFASALLNPS